MPPAGQADSYCATVTVDRAVTVLARAYTGSEWSALAEAAYSVARPAGYYAPLHVSELLYAPPAPAAGSPYINDDFAWLELRNAGAAPLALEGVRFASGISHTFGPVALGPGARLVLLGDKDQLASVEAGAVLGDLCRDAQAGRYDAETARYLLATTGEALPARYVEAAGTAPALVARTRATTPRPVVGLRVPARPALLACLVLPGTAVRPCITGRAARPMLGSTRQPQATMTFSWPGRTPPEKRRPQLPSSRATRPEALTISGAMPRRLA